MAGADLVAHVEAVAIHAGHGKGVEVLAPVEADEVLDHLGVGAKAAGGDDDRLGGDVDFLAVLVDGLHAHDSALVVGDELLAGGLEHELDAQCLGTLGHALGHRGRGARAGLGAVLGLDDVPGVLAVGVSAGALAGAERGAHGVELDAHVHEPLDGVAALEVVRAHKAGVNLVVGIEHVATEQLARGDLDHRGLLHRGAGRAGAHAHVGGAAGVGRLFQSDDACAVLRGRNRRSESGETRRNDDNVGFKLLGHVIPPCLGQQDALCNVDT